MTEQIRPPHSIPLAILHPGIDLSGLPGLPPGAIRPGELDHFASWVHGPRQEGRRTWLAALGLRVCKIDRPTLDGANIIAIEKPITSATGFKLAADEYYPAYDGLGLLVEGTVNAQGGLDFPDGGHLEPFPDMDATIISPANDEAKLWPGSRFMGRFTRPSHLSPEEVLDITNGLDIIFPTAGQAWHVMAFALSEVQGPTYQQHDTPARYWALLPESSAPHTTPPAEVTKDKTSTPAAPDFMHPALAALPEKPQPDEIAAVLPILIEAAYELEAPDFENHLRTCLTALAPHQEHYIRYLMTAAQIANQRALCPSFIFIAAGSSNIEPLMRLAWEELAAILNPITNVFILGITAEEMDYLVNTVDRLLRTYGSRNPLDGEQRKQAEAILDTLKGKYSSIGALAIVTATEARSK